MMLAIKVALFPTDLVYNHAGRFAEGIVPFSRAVELRDTFSV
jgi:hypothetical protein